MAYVPPVAQAKDTQHHDEDGAPLKPGRVGVIRPEDRVVEQHLDRRVYQDGRASVDQPRQTVHHGGDEAAAEKDQRDAQPQTNEQQGHIAVCRAADRQDIVQAHDHVGQDDRADGTGQRARLFDHLRAMGLAQDLIRNPGQEGAAAGLEERDPEQHGDQSGEHDPERHRADAPKYNRPSPLLGRQQPCSHADDDRIVTTEHQVDHDDAEEGLEQVQRSV